MNHRRSSIPLYLSLFLGLFALQHVAFAEWLLTTSDFQSQRVDVRSIDASGVTILAGPGSTQVIDFNHFLNLQQSGPAMTRPQDFVIYLAGGDRITGQPTAIKNEQLVCGGNLLGMLAIPMKQVLSIGRADQPQVVTPLAQTEDIVILQNRDAVRGIISGIDGTTLTVQSAEGEKTPVPLASVARISFAQTGAPAGAAAPARGFRVSLADGTALTAVKAQLEDRGLKLTLSDGSEPTVTMVAVRSIEQMNGPVVWLSTLTPVEASQKPFLDHPWPAQMDRAADGGPIRFGDHTYARGIGVHSYSLLTYAIDPSWKSFRTQYAIAGDWPYADVTVRVKLDGQVVHEQKNFHTGALAPMVSIDLTGHKQLSLEVDYGENYDVQDRLNWIEPAFLNFSLPATAP